MARSLQEHRSQSFEQIAYLTFSHFSIHYIHGIFEVLELRRQGFGNFLLHVVEHTSLVGESANLLNHIFIADLTLGDTFLYFRC